ncbi:SAF domain-containing protein [Paratractidigestivibacter sp.]|uniref:SAF domain-containing protein n=1 Tax=Paratractidigestivibacter sp. TaxID=2847316 RepID=UPI002AC93BD8|nr:SAF domain-containing protein [Paratractidigestivibacter sp.]
MSRRFKILLSGAFAVLTAGLCLLYGQEVRADAERQRSEVLERFGGETVRLIVATDSLEAGDTVSRQNVSEKEWVADLAPEGALTSLDDAVDRKVTVPVVAGAPLTELNFRDEAQMPEVPAGYIAVQVPVTEKLGLPDAVPAGSRLVAYEVSDDGTKVVSADIRVLLAASASSSAMSRGSLSVAVKPDFVAAILTASAEGSLRLVLPADDVESGETAQAPAQVEAAAEAGAAPAEGGDAK